MNIRCLIKNEGNLKVALSLEFGLAAQASTIKEAKQKLENQIEEYINDALTADEDKKKYLLSRKGHWQWFVMYYSVYWLSKLHIFKAKKILAFTENKFGTIKHA